MIQVSNEYWVQPDPRNLILYRITNEKKDGEVREVKTRLGYMRDWKQIYDKLLKDAVQQEEITSLKEVIGKMDGLRNELFVHFSEVLAAATASTEVNDEESEEAEEL